MKEQLLKKDYQRKEGNKGVEEMKKSWRKKKLKGILEEKEERMKEERKEGRIKNGRNESLWETMKM